MLLGMKRASPSSPWHVVREPGAARALERADLRELVQALLGREETVSSVARELHLTLNAAYLKLRTLRRVGLVRVTREERRAGRAVKHYTAVAPHLFVPFDVTGMPDLETLYLRLAAEQAQLFVRALLATYRRTWGEPGSLGTSLYRDEGGNPVSTFGPTPGTTWSSLEDHRPATLSNTGTAWLTFEEAKAFQRELDDLYRRSVRPPQPGRHAYLFTLGLTPVEEDAFTAWQAVQISRGVGAPEEP